MTDIENRLNEICLRALLRYAGNGEPSPYGGEVKRIIDEDIDSLRMWWALSEPVGALATRCVSNPREISSHYSDLRTEVSGVLTGPPDAAASVILQATTCNPTAFVVTESADTWITGPNRVLARTLHMAQLSLQPAALHALGGIFEKKAKERLALIDDALRIAPIREVLTSPDGRSRIVPYERRQAAKARAPLYQLAWKCASTLYGIESFDLGIISDLLASGVLWTIEPWRRFEMACIIEAAEALSGVAHEPYHLDISFSSKRPVARIGDIKIWWQRSIPLRPESELDTSERISLNLSKSLGVSSGTPRADIAIEKNGRVLSLLECKWFEAEQSASTSILLASQQITNYARNASYHQNEDVSAMLSHSIIALAYRGDAPFRVASGPIGCIDLSDLGGNKLEPWARSIIDAA